MPIEIEERLQLYLEDELYPVVWDEEIVTARLMGQLRTDDREFVSDLVGPLNNWVAERRPPTPDDGFELARQAYDGWSLGRMHRYALELDLGLLRVDGEPVLANLEDAVADVLARRQSYDVAALLVDLTERVPIDRGRTLRQRRRDDERRKRLEQKGPGLTRE